MNSGLNQKCMYKVVVDTYKKREEKNIYHQSKMNQVNNIFSSLVVVVIAAAALLFKMSAKDRNVCVERERERERDFYKTSIFISSEYVHT